MKALYFENKTLSVKDVAKPSPQKGESIIRVISAGICNTDIEIIKGYMGFTGIPGHEFVGVVESSDHDNLINRRVVGEINLPCHDCEYCNSGPANHCPNRSVLGIFNKDGAFAEYITLPSENLHIIPDDIPSEAATFIEPVAACFEIILQVDLKNKNVAVLGDGKLGILAARVLKDEGAKKLVLVGRHDKKLKLVHDDGIQTSLAGPFQKMISDPGEKFDIVVEATGRPDGFQLALDAVRPKGTIIQKTTIEGKPRIDLSKIVVDEITVIGSRCGPFEPAIEAISSGRVKVDDLITNTYPLVKGVEAFKEAAAPGSMKILLEVNKA
jgi:threonine dehydrogenase-like Zn-dependent dehydrogenase